MTRIIFLLLFSFCLSISTAEAQRSWRDSLSVLNRAIEQHPQSTDLRLKKAAVNIELNQWEYAIEEYGRVLDIDEHNLSALFYRAYAHNHQHEYVLARADYERFLAILPRHFEARLGLAMTQRRLGNVLEATNELNRLVEMFPDSANAWAARASYEAEQKQHELALYDWDEALRLSPDNAEYLAAKADVLMALGRKKEARRIMRQLPLSREPAPQDSGRNP